MYWTVHHSFVNSLAVLNEDFTFSRLISLKIPSPKDGWCPVPVQLSGFWDHFPNLTHISLIPLYFFETEFIFASEQGLPPTSGISQKTFNTLDLLGSMKSCGRLVRGTCEMLVQI
jgi:hypothetical protein